MRWRWAQALNRLVGKSLLAGGASPNQEGDKTGGINRVFRYFYANRLKAKALKQRNNPLYQTLKWGHRRAGRGGHPLELMAAPGGALGARVADDHFADLHHRLQVGVVADVA